MGCLNCLGLCCGDEGKRCGLDVVTGAPVVRHDVGTHERAGAVHVTAVLGLRQRLAHRLVVLRAEQHLGVVRVLWQRHRLVHLGFKHIEAFRVLDQVGGLLREVMNALQFLDVVALLLRSRDAGHVRLLDAMEESQSPSEGRQPLLRRGWHAVDVFGCSELHRDVVGRDVCGTVRHHSRCVQPTGWREDELLRRPWRGLRFAIADGRRCVLSQAQNRHVALGDRLEWDPHIAVRVREQPRVRGLRVQPELSSECRGVVLRGVLEDLHLHAKVGVHQELFAVLEGGDHAGVPGLKPLSALWRRGACNEESLRAVDVSAGGGVAPQEDPLVDVFQGEVVVLIGRERLCRWVIRLDLDPPVPFGLVGLDPNPQPFPHHDAALLERLCEAGSVGIGFAGPCVHVRVEVVGVEGCFGHWGPGLLLLLRRHPPKKSEGNAQGRYASWRLLRNG